MVFINQKSEPIGLAFWFEWGVFADLLFAGVGGELGAYQVHQALR